MPRFSPATRSGWPLRTEHGDPDRHPDAQIGGRGERRVGLVFRANRSSVMQLIQVNFAQFRAVNANGTQSEARRGRGTGPEDPFGKIRSQTSAVWGGGEKKFSMMALKVAGSSTMAASTLRSISIPAFFRRYK